MGGDQAMIGEFLRDFRNCPLLPLAGEGLLLRINTDERQKFVASGQIVILPCSALPRNIRVRH